MSKRSVISIHLGQCGVQVGSSIWELYNFEHDIQNDGSRYIPDTAALGTNVDNFRTFYYETASGKFVPKALFIDTEPSVMDALRQSSLGGMIHSNFMINNTQDCRNVMGLAWYPTFCGQPFHKLVKRSVRKLRELCDTLSGNMYYLSTSGGTGTGISCRALQEMKFCDQKSVNYAMSVAPSVSISGNPLECLNTISYLGITRFDNLGMSMHNIFDNEALYRQYNRLMGQKFSPTFRHLNQLIAMSVSSCTASLRFDGQLNVDLNEYRTNLIPIPTLNLMFMSMAPLDMDEDKELLSTKEITYASMTPEACMCSVDPFAFANKWAGAEQWWGRPTMWEDEAMENKKQIEASGVPPNLKQWQINHRFIAACVMYRGDLMPATINRAMQAFTDDKQPKFVQWVPCGFKVGINSPPMRTPGNWPIKDMSRSVCNVINNTVISEKIKQIVCYYKTNDRLSAYANWGYIGGLETSLVDSCCNGLMDQIKQYHYCMASQVSVNEIKEVLSERPQPLGKF